MLGYIYYIERNYKKAMVYYKKTIEQANKYYGKDDIDAEFMIGQCYFYDNDYTQAIYWYRKAANQGCTDAQIRLGLCYFSGNGVSKDGNIALYWLEKGLAGDINRLSDTNINASKAIVKSLKEEGYSCSQAKP